LHKKLNESIKSLMNLLKAKNFTKPPCLALERASAHAEEQNPLVSNLQRGNDRAGTLPSAPLGARSTPGLGRVAWPSSLPRGTAWERTSRVPPGP